MKVKIEFEIDNAAFEEDDREIDKVLTRAAEKIFNNRVDDDYVGDELYDEFSSHIRDSFGNTVGSVEVVE